MNTLQPSDHTPATGPREDQEDFDTLDYLVTRFATKEVAPHVLEWDRAGEFPRTLYARAAQLGLLGLGYPEDLGGTPASQRMRNVMSQALARHGASGGVFAGLFSHNIGLPPVRGWTAITMSSTAKRPSSPPACGLTSSQWRCAPMMAHQHRTGLIARRRAVLGASR